MCIGNFLIMGKQFFCSCIQDMIPILFIFVSVRWMSISNVLIKFEDDVNEIVSATLVTDRQTNKLTNDTNQHTCDFRK